MLSCLLHMEHMGTILDGRLRVALVAHYCAGDPSLDWNWCIVVSEQSAPIVLRLSFHLSATTSGVAHLNVENFRHRHSTATAILSYIEVYLSHPSQLFRFRASWSCTILAIVSSGDSPGRVLTNTFHLPAAQVWLSPERPEGGKKWSVQLGWWETLVFS